jgi:hypothetical protein
LAPQAHGIAQQGGLCEIGLPIIFPNNTVHYNNEFISMKLEEIKLQIEITSPNTEIKWFSLMRLTYRPNKDGIKRLETSIYFECTHS